MAELKVHISGAVRNPGVYAVVEGDRLDEVMEAAGGSSKPTTKSGPSRLEQAAEHYNKGLEHRDRAWEQEGKAASA